jgi:hypothetical protein
MTADYSEMTSAVNVTLTVLALAVIPVQPLIRRLQWNEQLTGGSVNDT